MSNIYRPRKSLYDWFVRWTEKGVWTDVFDTLSQIGGPALEVMIDSTAVQHRVAHGGKREAQPHAMGPVRWGPGSKIHGLSDNWKRPIALYRTSANVSDFAGAEALLPRIPKNGVLHGDKGYDSDHIRRTVAA